MKEYEVIDGEIYEKQPPPVKVDVNQVKSDLEAEQNALNSALVAQKEANATVTAHTDRVNVLTAILDSVQ